MAPWKSIESPYLFGIGNFFKNHSDNKRYFVDNVLNYQKVKENVLDVF